MHPSTFLLAIAGAVAMALQTLPPTSPSSTNTTSGGCGGFLLDDDSAPRTVYITHSLASHRDSQGLTLIPPLGLEFASTFLEDLNSASSSGKPWKLFVVGDEIPDNAPGGIYLDLYRGDDLTTTFTYANGSPTEEGYSLSVASTRATICGSGARGVWWGTRTLLQHMMLSNWTSVPAMQVTDVPAYATRGLMLDAGRKWYSPSFLKDLCTYASFFKMSEFHYHTSDNYPLNRGRNDTWSEVYAQFSLRPESTELQGLVRSPNETLSRADFEDLQQHCARRGITVIPEIEAPGHCLAITKWKPELALLDKKDLLNLTHPDSIPTVQRVWSEFLPWFQTKEVHIGADEYDDSLADDYIRFVNEMSAFVREVSGKKIRIWGTYEPSPTNLTISKDVIVQHWQYGQSDPVQLQAEGYDLINTEDWWAYVSLKNDHVPISPAPYPQFFDEARVLGFAGREGWQWHPALVNPYNATEQLAPETPELRGAIMAAWNDNGPDATTQLEAYYSMRRGIPLVAARAWSGARGPLLDTATLEAAIEFLAVRAPGQNLDRRLAGQEDTTSDAPLVEWARGERRQKQQETVILGHGSKGMNYTLVLSVTGPFALSSADASLTLAADGSLVFESDDGWTYPLRSVAEADGFGADHPGRIWANATSSSHVPVAVHLPAEKETEIRITGDVLGGCRVWVDGAFAGRFEVFVYGGRNTAFSWSQMAFVAPLERMVGGVERLMLYARSGVGV
ncbi:putative beta-N-hexosaminidase [Biscogniauxia mediterranea]|nr:putative beta-N-hexosaminidase [Biscogniauxia mediterranea]